MSRPVRKCPDAYAETAIDDEIVVMRLSDGDFFSLEGSARVIWLAIDGMRDRAALAVLLAEEFGTPPEVVEADIARFLDELAAAGLVEG